MSMHRFASAKHGRLAIVGLVLLTIAQINRYTAERQHLVSDRTDAFTGLLFGLAIGMLLVAVVRGAKLRKRH